MWCPARRSSVQSQAQLCFDLAAACLTGKRTPFADLADTDAASFKKLQKKIKVQSKGSDAKVIIFVVLTCISIASFGF